MKQNLSNRVGLAAERFVPGGEPGQVIEVEHLARYWWASGLVAGARVLDAGCGVGYGTALLAAAGTREITGVDVAADAVAAAAEAHPLARFTTADIRELPFPDEAFDVVVCFEVIEHIRDQDSVIAELARVLAPGGVLAISSPNRGVYPAGNPHHVHEYTPQELHMALSAHFGHVELLRQLDWVASAVFSDAEMSRDRLLELDVEVAKPVRANPASATYTVGLASDAALPDLRSRVVLGGVEELRVGLQAPALARERDQLRLDLANLQRIEAALREEKAELLYQLEEVRGTLRRIHASTFWRMGRPLRGLGRWASNARRG